MTMVAPAKRGSKADESSVEENTATLNPESAEAVMTPGELRDIASMDDAIALIQRTVGVSVVEAREELGDGFEYIENKERLVGIPCLFVKWDCNFSSSFTDDRGLPLRNVQAWVVCERAGQIRKYRIADFSTGISQQLWEYSERTGRYSGLAAPLGLRKSEFTYRNPDTGETSQASTYYIDVADPHK
jgi:hypothetical protein